MKKILLKIYYTFLNIKDNIVIFYNKKITLNRKPPIVMNTDETLKRIINDKCSVSRFGDGEFSLIYGESLKFQANSSEMSNRLREILISNKNNHIVCIPNVFQNMEWATNNAKKYWVRYLNIKRSKIYKILDMNKIYYDALVKRLYIDIKDKRKVEKRFNLVKSLWNNREVVIVEGEKSRLGIGNDLFNGCKTIERIICPSINAFSKYDEILKEVKKQDKSKLILIALGPTATILAYDLANAGYQAIDIGHIDIEYEWYLMKAKEKCSVKYKYIGEIKDGDKVSNINNEIYRNEIIKSLL